MDTVTAPRTLAAPSHPSLTFWRVLVAALALFAVLFQLGSRGLNEPDEGRYAEIGREMAATNDYLVPCLDGLPHLAKPPLTYWLIALSLKMFGVNDFAARLPAALAALGTLLAVYLLARNAYGEATGLWAAAVLLSSGMFFVVARLITTDMILTCCITWSVWLLWRWYTAPGRRWSTLAWFYVCLGLGLLTKGPVAVLLPLFALAGLRWGNPQLSLRHLRWRRGLLILLAVAAPWFVAVAARYPGLWHYFVVREVLERVATTVHGRVKPWWFFLPVLAGGFLPWTAFLPALAVTGSTNGRQRELQRACAAWAVLGLALFTVSRSKLPTYVLPLLPPLAILVAVVLGPSGPASSALRRARWVQHCARAAWGLFLGALICLVLLARSQYGLATQPAALLLGLSGAGALVASWFLLRSRPAPLPGVLGGTALAVYLAVALVMPSIERNLQGKTPAKFLAAAIRHEDPAQQAPVLACDNFPRGLPFYLQRPVLWYHPNARPDQDVFEFNAVREPAAHVLTDPERVRGLLAGPERVFCVATRDKFATIRRELKVRLYWLEEAGDWLLFSNRPATPEPLAPARPRQTP